MLHTVEVSICSFGSGFNLENTDPDYISTIAQQVMLAGKYNMEVGGSAHYLACSCIGEWLHGCRYDLIDLDRGGMPSWDCIDTSGHVTGNACFASGW